MNDLVIDVKTELPIISSNFDAAKSQLSNILKEYDLIVDKNSVKTAKKMATELNKMSKQIDTVRKEKVSELSAPIKEFETEAKSLSNLCQESRQKLLSQVKVFEDKQRAECKRLLDMELIVTYKKYGVREEFQTVETDDLAIISNLNKGGLVKKAVDAVDKRVLKAKEFQEKIDKRLMTLETICFKGGLQAPLTRENINHFLMEEDDNIYLEKLVSLIQNEIARLDAMKKREEKQTQIQQPKPVVNATPVQEPQVQKQGKYDNFKNNVFAPKSRKKTYTVTAVFEVEVDERMESKLEAMLLEKFKDSGFKQIPTVYVEKLQQAG